LVYFLSIRFQSPSSSRSSFLALYTPTTDPLGMAAHEETLSNASIATGQSVHSTVIIVQVVQGIRTLAFCLTTDNLRWPSKHAAHSGQLLAVEIQASNPLPLFKHSNTSSPFGQSVKPPLRLEFALTSVFTAAKEPVREARCCFANFFRESTGLEARLRVHLENHSTSSNSQILLVLETEIDSLNAKSLPQVNCTTWPGRPALSQRARQGRAGASANDRNRKLGGGNNAQIERSVGRFDCLKNRPLRRNRQCGKSNTQG